MHYFSHFKFKKKKGGKGAKKGSKNGKSTSVYDYYYPGSAAETNRPRRRDMERLKERRDEFLEGKKELLLHFLPDNDYFKKKEKREKRVIEKDKKMKEEAVSLAFNTAQVGYTRTIDNSGSSVDDAAKLIASLSGCESAPIIDTDAVKNGDPQTDIPHQSVEEVESGGATSSSRSVNWDCKSPVEIGRAHV